MGIAYTQHLIPGQDHLTCVFQLILGVAFRHLEENGVILRLLPVELLIIICRKVKVMAHIILTDLADLYFPVPFFLIPENNGVPHFHIQKVRGLLCNDSPVIRKLVAFMSLPVPEAEEIPALLSVAQHARVCFMSVFAMLQGLVHHIHIQEILHVGIFLQESFQLLALFPA